MNTKTYIVTVLSAIADAQNEGLKVRPPRGILGGFSGEKIMGLLQRLLDLDTGDRLPVYLEVGVFQGMTLLSTALSNPRAVCYGIDNFSQFDVGGQNLEIVKARARTLGVQNYYILNEDFETALENLPEKIDDKISVYFVDGPHDYRSQIICLTLAIPYLMDSAVIVIDDCNYPHVRQATYDFLKIRPDCKLIFEAYTSKHPQNMASSELDQARKGWWNGVHVLMHDPEDLVAGLTPPVPDQKSQFFSDHAVHSMAFGPLAIESINFAQAFASPWRVPRAAARLVKNYVKRFAKLKGAYRIGNTASGDLPKSRTATLNTCSGSDVIAGSSGE